MAKMELTYEQTEHIFFEMDVGEEWEGFKLIEEAEWIGGGKYQYKSIVFEYDGRTWMFDVDRNGSYFSDYYYGFREGGYGLTAQEVEKKEKVIYEWVYVED
jgi:hypothetical protein